MEELCQCQKEYESGVNGIEAQITELLYCRSLYEKDFHSEIVFIDNNIEVKFLYDDFLKELFEVAEGREVSSNG